MGYVRKFLMICFILFLSGCSTLGNKNMTFESGYRAGVKENMQDFAGNFYGNDFPYSYWASPVVQNVKIPAHIENGVFIPEHSEPVVIEAGQWRNKLTYPISCPEHKEARNKSEGDEQYAFNYLNLGVRDITVLPESFICAKPGAKDKDSR